MKGGQTTLRRDNRSRRLSLAKFAVGGAVLGLLAGLIWGWLDYGRPDLGFMYGHVLGTIIIFSIVGMVIAAAANWARRNPMA